MGLYDWPPESSRQPGNSEKARRNISLEFRCDLDLHGRRRIRLGGCFGPREIKVAPVGDAACEPDVKRLEARIGGLPATAILAVLDPCVVHLQLPFWRYDIIGAKTFVKQLSEDTKFPIVTGSINQGRSREDAFQTQVVGEQPEQATAWGDYWIRIERATDAEHAKDFIFLERESEKGFPGYIEIVAMDVILEIDTRINPNTCAGVIVHDMINRQQCVHERDVIG